WSKYLVAYFRRNHDDRDLQVYWCEPRDSYCRPAHDLLVVQKGHPLCSKPVFSCFSGKIFSFATLLSLRLCVKFFGCGSAALRQPPRSLHLCGEVPFQDLMHERRWNRKPDFESLTELTNPVILSPL